MKEVYVKRFSFSMAILMHVVLAIIILVAFSTTNTHQKKRIGWQQVKVIKSFLYKPAKISRKNSQHQKSRWMQSQKRINKENGTLEIHRQKKLKSKQSSSKKRNLSHGQFQAILIKLHNQIVQYQFYPRAAQFLHQHGKVELEFILLPNGNIKDLHVIKSSGYDILDNAAVAAVRASQPFSNIDLHQAQTFKIDLLYKI